jgi:hypothetical protein
MAVGSLGNCEPSRGATHKAAMDWDEFNPSVQSRIGRASHADGLRLVLSANTLFARRSDRGASCG